jgi:hypothetical protein
VASCLIGWEMKGRNVDGVSFMRNDTNWWGIVGILAGGCGGAFMFC